MLTKLNHQGQVLPGAGSEARTGVRPSELLALMKDLENAIAGAETAASGLFERLGPVRMAVPTSDQGADNLPSGACSPLGNALAGNIMRLHALTRSMNSIAEELAL